MNGSDAPVPIEIQGVRKPASWEPFRVHVEDGPAKPKPGGGER